MNDLIIKRLFRAMELTQDLFTLLENESLQLKLLDLPSNTIFGQVWCLIGARESFTDAINEGTWKGFSCSLSKGDDISRIRKLLSSTYDELRDIIIDGNLARTQLEYVMDVLEHEIQHHGQLIRYIYAHKLEFPNSWKQRYTV